jgi:hypothetical protein
MACGMVGECRCPESPRQEDGPGPRYVHYRDVRASAGNTVFKSLGQLDHSWIAAATNVIHVTS